MRRPPPACWISSMTTEDRNQRTRKPVESLADGKRTGKAAVIKNGGLAWVSGSRRTFTLGIAGLSADPSSVPMRRPVRCLAWPDLSASLKSRQVLRVQSYCHVALSGKRLCAVHQHFHRQGHERIPGLPSVGAEFVGRGQAARFGRRSAAHGGQGGEFHALRSRRRGLCLHCECTPADGPMLLLKSPDSGSSLPEPVQLVWPLRNGKRRSRATSALPSDTEYVRGSRAVLPGHRSPRLPPRALPSHDVHPTPLGPLSARSCAPRVWNVCQRSAGQARPPQHSSSVRNIPPPGRAFERRIPAILPVGSRVEGH